MKVRKFQMSSGFKYAVLVDNTGMPMPYPNLFVTEHYFKTSEASNTCKAVFDRLKYLYEICDFLEIDLVKRSLRGEFLTKAEVSEIVHWASYKVDSFREKREKLKQTKVVKITKKSNLEAARVSIVVDKGGWCDIDTTYNRVTTFSKYVSWLDKTLFPSKKSETEILFKSHRSRKVGSKKETYDEEKYKSLSSTEMSAVLDMVRPDSSRNPWKRGSIRYRNYLIIHMYEALGIRRGELLKIRIDDVKTHPRNGRRYVTVRSKTDLEDNRADRPEAKTLGRNIPMDKRLSDMFDDYVIYHRSNVKGVEKVPYLFVPHGDSFKKSGLSISSVDKIMREISQSVNFNVNAHAFRHSWNDKYSEYADRKIAEGRTTHNKAESDRLKLMGWSETSEMAKWYSQRYERRRAFEVGLELQEKGSAKINNATEAHDEDVNY